MSRLVLALSLCFGLFGATAPGVCAEDEATFRIEFRDGVVMPQKLEVPANKRIVIELVNSGQTPAEFESKELRKEKVVAAGATSSIVLRSLDPGTYDFFDDFHPDAAPATLIAK